MIDLVDRNAIHKRSRHINERKIRTDHLNEVGIRERAERELIILIRTNLQSSVPSTFQTMYIVPSINHHFVKFSFLFV